MINKSILLSEIKHLVDTLIGTEYQLIIEDDQQLVKEDILEYNVNDNHECQVLFVASCSKEISYLYDLSLMSLIISVNNNLELSIFQKFEAIIVPNRYGVFRFLSPRYNSNIHKDFISNDRLKTKLYNKIISYLMRLNLVSLINGIRLNIYSSFAIKDKLQFNDKTFPFVCISFGAPGYDRKSVLMETQDSLKRYTKIVSSNRSRELISNEQDAINYISDRNPLSFSIPTVIAKSSESLTTSGPLGVTRRLNNLTDSHYRFLAEMYWMSRQNDEKVLASALKKISDELEKLNAVELISDYKQLLDFAIGTEKKFRSRSFKTCACHGDFTPWNIYVLDSELLFVYDWELYSKTCFPLFDYFHFFCQTDIFLGREKAQLTLKNMINYRSKEIEEILLDSNLSIWECLDLYLLERITYTMSRLVNQGAVTTEQERMICFWTELINTRLLM